MPTMYATNDLVVFTPMPTSRVVFGREICMGAKNVDLFVVMISKLVLLWPDSDTLASFRCSRVY